MAPVVAILTIYVHNAPIFTKMVVWLTRINYLIYNKIIKLILCIFNCI